MKLSRRYLLAAIAAIAATGCNIIETPEDRTPVSLKYSTVRAVDTKASQNLNVGTFDSGETVKVRVSEAGAGAWTGYDFTTGADGAMTAPEPGPYYPAGSTNIDIAAFYPATAGTTFTVQADQTADASYKASDLMFASVSNQAKQAAPVELSFAHKMAKINVNITAGDGVGSITGVSILNVKPTVPFDQATGAVGEASGTATSIAVSNEGAAVIPAQTIDGGLLSIATDMGTATYSVADKEFEAGKQYKLNITVNLRAVGATTAITGWNGEGTVNVNPVAEPLTVLNVTAEHLGWVIAGDGYVYRDKAAVEAAGKTGVAVIFHVGAPGSADADGVSFRGLAMSITVTRCNWGYEDHGAYCLPTQYATFNTALTDMHGIQNTMILKTHSHTRNHAAALATASFETPAPAGTSGWFLGSLGQWNLFMAGLCGITWNDDGKSVTGDVYSLAAPFEAAGYPDFFTPAELESNAYWTSTEGQDTEINAPLAWMITLYYYHPTVLVYKDDKAKGGIVRPFVAF